MNTRASLLTSKTTSTWTNGCKAEPKKGTHSRNMQPVVYAGSLYVLATMELVNVEDYDNPA